MTAGPKPKGPDEVRRALLDAATRQFVAKGLRASLRDIAADASVNLGLIHHHFGNKDDLLRAVFDDLSRQGVNLVGVTMTGPAVRSLFELSMSAPSHARLAAWLMLDDEAKVFGDRNELLQSLRDATSSDDHRRSLIMALTLMYGWTVFGDFLATVFGEHDGHRDELHRTIAEHIERLASGKPESGPVD